MDEKNYSPKHGEFEDVSSTSGKNGGFEDISSDTGRAASGKHEAVRFEKQPDEIFFSSVSDNGGNAHSHRKEKKGIAGFFSKTGRGISNWWRRLAKGQKAAVITLTCLLLIVCIALGGMAVFLKDFNHDDKFPTNSEDLGTTSKIDDRIINIALFGIDTRKKGCFEGLSDSIMILSLNTETKKVKIISLMRDSLVPIEYKGKTTYSKLNQAYAKGGPELAVKTLNKLCGLDMTEYAAVNFYGMEDIINAVGGIDATLTEGEVTARGKGNHGINDMIEEVCQLKGIKNPEKYFVTKSGKQHLNGLQAVAYSRIRYVKNIWGTNNDYGRTDRQRYVMQQLFNKALALKKSEYPSFAKKIFPYVKTSLGISEIIDIASSMLLDSPTFEQCRVPMSEKGIYFTMTAPKGKFGSVVYYDLDYAGKVIRAVIYNDVTIEEFVKSNPVEKNDWYGKLFPESRENGSSSSSVTSSDSSGDTVSDDTSSDISSDVSSDTSSVDDGSSSEITSSETDSSEPQETTEE